MKDSEYLEMPWSIEDTIENLNEIKEMLKRKLVNANMDGKAESDVKELEFDFDRAIQALSEVEQYRAIGLTPEWIEAMKGHNIALINDLGEYQQIGTIERFRELTEKAEPKKVVIRKIPKTEWTRAVKQYICPSCGAVISFGGKRYCSGCGQRLDWE